MATAKSLPFANFVLKLGDGASPEVFTAVGACTSRSFKSKLKTGSTDVPDDTDDAAPMFTEEEGMSLQFEVTFDGVYSLGGAAKMRTWHLSTFAKNIQLVVDETLANDGGMYQGAALFTDYSLDGKKGERVTISGTLTSSGAYAWVPATS